MENVKLVIHSQGEGRSNILKRYLEFVIERFADV